MIVNNIKNTRLIVNNVKKLIVNNIKKTTGSGMAIFSNIKCDAFCLRSEKERCLQQNTRCAPLFHRFFNIVYNKTWKGR